VPPSEPFAIRQRLRRSLAVLLSAALVSWAVASERDEERVAAELERLSHGGGPGEYFAGFDHICFDFVSGSARKEFAEAAARKSIPLATSLAQCGVNRSCCNLDSDVTGVIGLINNGAIRCVSLRKASSAFLAEPQRALCAKPSDLIVKRESFSTRLQPPGRPWMSNPGQFYYKIMENHQ
jgi:hypothetical protein